MFAIVLVGCCAERARAIRACEAGKCAVVRNRGFRKREKLSGIAGRLVVAMKDRERARRFELSSREFLFSCNATHARRKT
jgi:hypothetical protein